MLRTQKLSKARSSTCAAVLAALLPSCAPTSAPDAMPGNEESESGNTASSTTGAVTTSMTDAESETGPIDPECGDGVHFGNLVITDMTAPEDTANITHVLGHATVADTATITDLSLLGGLLCVDGTFYVQRNSAIQSLDGLALRRAQRVRVEANPLLEDANGLSSVLQVGELALLDNPSLAIFPYLASNLVFADPLAGFRIGGNGFSDLDIFLQGWEPTIEADSFSIRITADQHLRSVRGLSVFAAGPAADIEITYPEGGNAALEEIELAGFEEVIHLKVVNAAPLRRLEAPDLKVAEWVSITGDHKLLDLSGLSSLEQVGTLALGCDGQAGPGRPDLGGGAITSLTGLAGLTTANMLLLKGLPHLTSLDGLSMPLAVDRLDIVGNHALPSAAADAFAAAVMPEIVAICDNADGPACEAEHFCFPLQGD